MKVTNVTTFPLRATIDHYFGASQGWSNTRNTVLVRIDTDEGVSGWGEAGAGRNQQTLCAFIEHGLKPIVVGRNPLDIEPIWEEAFRLYAGDGLTKGVVMQAMSGIDIALWDIAGKVLNQPIHMLLGGRFRDKVAVYATGMYYTETKDQPKALADEAQMYLSQGFKAMKMKIGGMSVEDDVKNIEAVRRAIGDRTLLMVDANRAYNAYTAIRMGRHLERLDVFWFEEPVHFEDWQAYKEVKDVLRVAVAGGECLAPRFAFKDFIAHRALDIAQPDTCNVGGITECRRIWAMTNTWGIQYIPHVWGSPIAIAAGLHLVAAMPVCPPCRNPQPFYQIPALEFDQTPNPLRDNLATKRFVQKDGYLDVPMGPGLGVEIDMGVVERYLMR